MSDASAKARSVGALQAFEAATGEIAKQGWLDAYHQLRSGGWHWRVAVYIAWASSPKTKRYPKTQDELATQFLGLTSDRVIATWRKKNPVIDDMIGVMQAAPLWESRADDFQALLEGAARAGHDHQYFKHLKLKLEMRKDYVPSTKIDAELRRRGLVPDDMADMPDEELLKLANMAKDEKSERDEVEEEK